VTVSQIKHQPLNQAVFRQLRELVLSGGLAPGEQLNEIAIADRLRVSRTPLRKAMNQLVAEGLVADSPYRGKFVRTFTAQEIQDLYEVRAVLEAHAARLAAAKMNAARLETLRGILKDVQNALERDELPGYGEADRRFHEAIAGFSENQTLIDSLQRLSSQVQLIRSMANQDPEVVRRTALERPRIVAALESGDAELAATLMQEHILGVRGSLTHPPSAPQLARGVDRVR
jgi:DNA-binding GntR family transcriptional regulator